MAELTILLIGSMIAAGYPIFWSLYKETRFTSKWNLIGYGVASIAFGLIFFGDPNIPKNLDILKPWALGIFMPFGVVSILAGCKVDDNDEDWKTLFLAGRQVGAFQASFLIMEFFGIQNKLINSLQVPSVIDYAIIFLIVFNVISGIVWIVRNKILKKN